MTQKLNEENQKELSWEEAVTRFLEDHPDFFQHHPEVLSQLHLTHATGGRSVSLIERQVQVLRSRNANLEQQLRELVGIARENDALAQRLHRFALAMAEARHLDEVFDAAYELLRQEFRLEAVAVRLRVDDGAGTRAELVAEDKRLAVLLKQLSAGKPVCGGRLDEGLKAYLFGAAAGEIKSAALIPLGEKSPLGMLALGSADAHRFHPGMGTVYLTRLGELLARAIARGRAAP